MGDRRQPHDHVTGTPSPRWIDRPAAARGRADLVGPVLALLAEGAWVSVLAAFLQAAGRDTWWLGPLGYGAAAAGGWIAARVLGPRYGEGWPVVAVAVVALGGLAGWLASPAVLDALAAGTPVAALGRHPAGWLAALATLRGMAHARSASSEGSLARLVSVALPGLAVPILIGGALAEPWRERFLEEATIGAVAFLIAATLGLAMTRMASVAARSGFDWRRNRAWLLLVAVVVIGVTLVAVPSAVAIGRLVQLALAILLLPAIVLGFVVSFSQITRRTMLVFVALIGLSLALLVLAPKPPPPSTPTEAAGGQVAETLTNPTFYAASTVVIGILIVLAIVVLTRLWMRQVGLPGDPDVLEERVIDRGDETMPRPRRAGPTWRRARQLPDPATAAAAYVALVDELARDEELARSSGETPAAHARRLRLSGRGAVGLELLAADYELERWAGRRISAPENRRGVARWRRLRTALRGPTSSV